MKLNLIDTTAVRRSSSGKTAPIIAALIALVGIGIGAFLTISSTNDLKNAKQRYADAGQLAADTVATAAKADEVVGDPRAVQIMKNLAVAKSMNEHNAKYPDLYDQVLSKVPPFFRVTSISAAPKDEKNSTVTLTGTIDSFKQYNDLIVALLRVPGATNIGRQGFTLDPMVVPSLVEEDQTGRPRKLSDPGPIPDDPLERLAYLQGLASVQQYDNVGGYGEVTDGAKGARPGSNLITVSFDVPKDLRVVDVRGTLQGVPGAAVPAGGVDRNAALAGGMPGVASGAPMAPGGVGGPSSPGAGSTPSPGGVPGIDGR